MKRLFIWSTFSGLILGILVCTLGWWLWNRPFSLEEARVDFETSPTIMVRIPQGMTMSSAADSLLQRGVLANRSVFLIGARLTGQDRGLRAGLYELSRGLSPRDLIAELVSGLSVQVRVTIPEGLSALEVAEILSTELGFSSKEFLASADSLVRDGIRDGGLLSGTKIPAGSVAEQEMVSFLDTLFQGGNGGDLHPLHWCEGYLAPDTYHFGEGTSAPVVASHLFQVQLARLNKAAGVMNTAASNLSLHSLLTLASLVEAEARLEEERELVAAVYSNRLARNWRLEADPTIAYLLQKKGQRLYFKDLKVDSPYNTYRRQGLPPGPIGSPGLASLIASAAPDSTCDAMYFVSDGDGGHVFSRTFQEHDEAVRRFRRMRSNGGRR